MTQLAVSFFAGVLVTVFLVVNGATNYSKSPNACEAFASITAQMVPEHVGDIVAGGHASSPGIDAVRDLLYACRDEGV